MKIKECDQKRVEEKEEVKNTWKWRNSRIYGEVGGALYRSQEGTNDSHVSLLTYTCQIRIFVCHISSTLLIRIIWYGWVGLGPVSFACSFIFNKYYLEKKNVGETHYDVRINFKYSVIVNFFFIILLYIIILLKVFNIYQNI